MLSSVLSAMLLTLWSEAIDRGCESVSGVDRSSSERLRPFIALVHAGSECIGIQKNQSVYQAPANVCVSRYSAVMGSGVSTAGAALKMG